jgi:hypothetical protein
LKDVCEAVWGQVEKVGRGTKASYDCAKKTVTFCFNRGPEMSGELLKRSRERLLQELNELGYVGRMRYNGEVVIDNVADGDVCVERKNHKLIIRLNKKQPKEKQP